MANPTPAISFLVNMSLPKTEIIGPSTNEKTTGMLHPDRHQTDQDQAVTDIDNRKNYNSTYFPTLTIFPNRILKHGDEFVEYGQKAVYLRDMYGVGYGPADRAFLEVVSVD